jgi:hypothetical protein
MSDPTRDSRGDDVAHNDGAAPADEEAREAAGEAQATGRAQMTDDELSSRAREQLKRVHALDLIEDMMVSLVTFAFQKLGLTAETRELRDLGDVRGAIEAVRRLVEVVESEGRGDDTSVFRSTLAQLQLEYARVASEAPAGPVESDETESQVEGEPSGEAASE